MVPTWKGFLGSGELTPSWPKLLAPQQNTKPPETAHVWLAPAATRDAERFSPVTFEVGSLLPSPTCPEEFEPQQETLDAEPMAQACASPAVTAVGADTVTMNGVAENAGEVVSPNCSTEFVPQQYRSGPETAHVKAVPAEIEVAGPRVATGPGPRGVIEVGPRPSWPKSFAPQQTTPAFVAAQLCRSPSASDTAPETFGTLTGPFPVATPSCWKSFAPQHIT